MSGFFGNIAKSDVVFPVFYGTDYHSHLGTKRAGMAFFNKKEGFQRAIHSLEDGYFRTKFEDDLKFFEGNSGVGVISDTEAQPLVTNSHLGKFAIATVSKIVNGNGIVVASESCSFANLDYQVDRYIGPGEIVRITADGVVQLRKPNKEMQICAFLWVYYGYPPSYYEGINVDEVRYRCGAALAKNDEVEADFVAGIPDSGVGHAMGYSNERRIPLTRPYAKYTPTWPRSFMPQTQDKRDLVAKMKLIPNPALIKNKRGVFLDDSIVRGTQLKDNTRDLHSEGIKEVHMRIACPPLTYPCEFLNFSRSRKTLELATRTAISQLKGTEEVDLEKYSNPETEEYKAMVERIRQNLGLTSLKFQKLNDLVEAIGLPKEKLCTHCWDNSSYF